MSMNSPDNAPAHDSGDTEALPICDYCHGNFTPKRKWQKFCSEVHRRAFERIIQKFSARLHPLIREAVKEINAAKLTQENT